MPERRNAGKQQRRSTQPAPLRRIFWTCSPAAPSAPGNTAQLVRNQVPMAKCERDIGDLLA
jgi:hypothetical protein